jgi:hypothetical protein
MARYPEQALYLCECDGEEAECPRCGGVGYLLWDDLTKDEQELAELRWEEGDW